MRIKVSAEDIVAGNNSKDACPITIALRRKFGQNIVVARSFIRKTNKKQECILVPLPKKAQNYYLDTIGPANRKPFEFELSASAVKKLRG